MPEIQICNFCELFGFNSRMNPVVRLELKIWDQVYPQGFEFTAGTTGGAMEIAKHLDDLALVYYEESGGLVLHTFVPDGTANKTLVNCTPEKRLYRYSKLEYLKDARQNGHFFIFPALEYIRNEYDAARKDNELVHEKAVAPEAVTITTLDKTPIVPLGDVTFSTYFLPIDSYILCCAYDYDEGLYDEFKRADACLVIHDVEEFAARLNTAFEKAMPSHIGANGRVTYGKHQSDFGVLFSKPRSYIYQREYRFSWIPDKPTRLLDPTSFINQNLDEIRAIIPAPVEVYTGPIEDITTLITRGQEQML
ncbi:MAG: hypothetical protein PHD54_08445 [Desulfuromonadaceae bacterium]|nr:hypothetical protein [Desulfuromonadaceae bacterium]